MLVVIDVDTSDKECAAKEICALIEHCMPRAREEVKKLPHLYKSGVKYIAQDPRACAMRSPKEVHERGGGDCKQLVIWRMAELLNAGIKATPRIIWLTESDRLTAHAQLRHPNGEIEDPSHSLGMK